MKLNLLRVFLLLVLFSSVNACRLGNYSDSPKYTAKSQFKSSELFFSEIKSFETIVYYTDGTHSINSQSPLVSVPAHLLNTFSNPFYWNVFDDAKQTQIFMDSYQSDYEQTMVDSNGKIDVQLTSAIAPLISNSICKTQLQILQAGNLDRTSPGTATLPGSAIRSPVSGKLRMDYTAIRVISGDCADSLRELSTCFQNGAGCTNDQLSEAHALFDLYVRGTGVLKIEDAIRIKGLVYVVHFD